MLVNSISKSIKGDPYAPDYYYQPVYSYKSIAPKLDYKGNVNIALVVHDQRPYIVSGKTKPQYIGQLRPASAWGGGGWDIPMNVITEDERTLADTLTGIISDAVRKAGFHVTTATIEPKERLNAKNYNQLRNTRNDKIVVVVLNEWMTDEFYNLGFAYDIFISVYSGESSNMAASYRLKGEGRSWVEREENREQRDARSVLQLRSE